MTESPPGLSVILGIADGIILELTDGMLEAEVKSMRKVLPWALAAAAAAAIVLVSPGLAKRTVMVELRAGEYEDVDVTLYR